MYTWIRYVLGSCKFWYVQCALLANQYEFKVGYYNYDFKLLYLDYFSFD